MIKVPSISNLISQHIKVHIDPPIICIANYFNLVIQSGDEDSLRAWNAICAKSRVEFQQVYDQLNVRVQERGESFYNPMLSGLVAGLREKGLVVDSEGAGCIFLATQAECDAAATKPKKGKKNRGDGGSEFVTPDGTPLPLLVQKSDGGFLYATTDLAAVRHRVQSERADRLIYVTDSGQAQHFSMVFQAAKLAEIIPNAGTTPSPVELTHVREPLWNTHPISISTNVSINNRSPIAPFQ